MVTLLLVLISSFTSAVTVCPGAKSFIGQSTFQSFMNSYVPHWTSQMESGQLSNVNFTLSLMLTSMDFRLKNIKMPIFNVDNNSATVVMTAPDLLTITFTGVDLLISADFDLYWFGHYVGNTSVYLQNATIVMPIKFQRVLNKPVIHYDRLDINAEKKRFRFSSNNLLLSALGLSQYIWPINLLENRIVWTGLEGISKSFNPVLSKFFGDLNYTYPVGNTNIAVNYGFTNIYISKPGYLTLGVVGGFEIPANPFDVPPVQYMNEIINWATTEDFRFQMTDFFFYSYFWALCETGYLNVTVNSGTFPQFAPYLTTSGLQLVIPGLQETYGDNWPLSIECGVAHYPSVTIDSSGIHLSLSVVCHLLVIKSIISSEALVFSWQMQSDLTTGVSSNSSDLYLQFNTSSSSTVFNNFQVLRTNIGPVNLKPLESAILFSLPSILHYINPMFGRTKIKIPLPGYTQVAETKSTTGYRAMEIGAKLKFSFP